MVFIPFITYSLLTDIYPSSLALSVRVLLSVTRPIPGPRSFGAAATSEAGLSKLLGIRCVAAFLQLQLFRVYKR